VAAAAEPKAKYQYHSGEIAIPQATADESHNEVASTAAAATYLDNGALAWIRQRKCISCHTSGTYLVVRSQLSTPLGPPSKEVHAFFRDTLRGFQAGTRESLQKGTVAEQLIYTAAGLAEWDAKVGKRLSQETDTALRLMLSTQLDSGTWTAADCWPPLESSAYQAATIAARALAIAPGWLAGVHDERLLGAVRRLKAYLRSDSAQNDYDRVSLLWTASAMTDLLSPDEQRKYMDIIFKYQRPDGGWSLRSFSAPEAWGAGNRATRLRAEPDFGSPASDGHMTGLALIALRGAGIPASDERIRRGVAWLLTNQRKSGRWWTRSLNTDEWHFITYSGTAYPLLALSLCNALPPR
jgi:squalene-hopene/tetraprenyl-beta-curcumene cyclase